MLSLVASCLRNEVFSPAMSEGCFSVRPNSGTLIYSKEKLLNTADRFCFYSHEQGIIT